MTTQSVELTGKELDTVKIKNVRLDTKDVEKYGKAISWKLNDKRPQGEKKITLDVTLDPATLSPGRFNSKIIIETDLEQAKLTEIQLAAEILGPLTVVPPRIYYSNYESGIMQVKEIKIESNEGVEFQILGASVNNDRFTIEKFDTAASISHTLKVQFNPDDQDRAKAILKVKTSSSEQPDLEVNIHGYKKRDRKSPAGSSMEARQKLSPNDLKHIEPMKSSPKSVGDRK